MDFTDALKAGGASATLIVIVGVGIKVIQMCMNHRLRSECCGKTATLAVSVEEVNRPPSETDRRPSQDRRASQEVKIDVV